LVNIEYDYILLYCSKRASSLEFVRMPVSFAEKFGSGLSSRRVEDERLLRGRGRYTANFDAGEVLHAAFLRSPHAHAKIIGIDVSGASSLQGVLLTLTGAQLQAQGLQPLAFANVLKAAAGHPMSPPPRWPLAVDRALYVGDPIALVVAADRETARSALEMISVDFEEMAAVVDVADAVADNALQIWHAAPGNVVGTFTVGDRAAVEAQFAKAAHITRLRCANNRVIVNPMEVRTVLASYNSEAGFVLRSGYQAPHLAKEVVARALNVAEDLVRVVVGDMGGGFGTRISPYPEDVALLQAARCLNATVKWQADRSELFLSDYHARDHISDVEVALDSAGRILAVRVDVLANLGAYLSYFGANAPTHTGNRVATGVYDIPCICVNVRAVLTNTVPTGPYRGAGRPEAIYRIERAIDAAAAELHLDPVELRRRNLVTAEMMPYETAAGATYDSGDYAAVLDAALIQSDYPTVAARRTEAQRRGQLFGWGIACHIDTTSSMIPSETVKVSYSHNGIVKVLSGTQAMGQGLETTFAQMVATRLQIPIERVMVLQGDTSLVPAGNGSYGSRSLYIGGSALALAVDDMLDNARTLLASRWGVDRDEIAIEGATFVHRRTGERCAFVDALAKTEKSLVEGCATFTALNCFPNGCYVCEVEIDPETGIVRVTKFTAVDDVGTIMHPTIVHGQIHGGVAQGIGQALLERCAYDDAGQLISGSFMDYAMPRASDLPSFSVGFEMTSSPTNPLGAKGGGESGAIGAPPAVVNAVVDALRPFGVRHIDMPIRSQIVWRLIQQGKARAAS
jgi:aerobic carbon-monoxide dehydrogenase large subunit